jgi:hypothetical protein
LTKIHLDESQIEKQTPPPLEIFTSRKHAMDYFTADGVILRTGYKNKRDWYLLPIREILDNDVDFLWKYYKGSNKASISVDVKIGPELFYLNIRNTNESNFSVFPDLESIFNYDMRYGSKQDVHTITRGMLGDAMKQILSLGYVLLHAGDDDRNSFTDKQWEHPLVIRHNREEWTIHLNYSKAQQQEDVKVIRTDNEIPYTDTEIELRLPIIDELRNALTRDYIEEFCTKYTLFTTDISFKFSIIDDINHKHEDQIQEQDLDIAKAVIDKLSKVPPKGILHINLPALHPISLEKDWSNADSIHSYTPEEFMRRIQNVHDKSISVYDVLFTFREGNRIKKTPENQISVSELISSEDRDKKMQELYEQLKNVLSPPSRLSLPYTTNTKKRRQALYSRIAHSKFYDVDTKKKYSYKLVKGFYNDSTVEYPFAFEILAIPRKDPLVSKPGEVARAKDTIFIGAVNYSVSPKTNNFEYDEHYGDSENYSTTRRDIFHILKWKGFKEPDTYSKLPCIIIANLITPRRDPLGHDKSTIDTKPFIDTIESAVEKMVSGIQTYSAVNIRFVRFKGRTSGRDHGDIRFGKKSGIEHLRRFLIKERGLPDI